VHDFPKTNACRIERLGGWIKNTPGAHLSKPLPPSGFARQSPRLFRRLWEKAPKVPVLNPVSAKTRPTRKRLDIFQPKKKQARPPGPAGWRTGLLFTVFQPRLPGVGVITSFQSAMPRHSLRLRQPGCHIPSVRLGDRSELRPLALRTPISRGVPLSDLLWDAIQFSIFSCQY
jgi:hypothetical protein